MCIRDSANATLAEIASDTIWFWLRIHDDTALTGLSLRLASGSRKGSPANFTKGVFWGAADAMPIGAPPPGAGEAGGASSARRAGGLPESEVWVRLEVPASAVWDLAG